ncbi:MAG: phospho-N-acetylmuramoyl-pentapeptide-transferase [Candidatus Sumerlaeota bacterium]|nr:phospho-N-acetylmuramoyl-pentapeptide-transferase [Candidatus Sumerlaeota bacterium]
MFPWLLELWTRALPADSGPLRLLGYISFRSALALGLAFVVSLAAGPAVIRWLRGIGYEQRIRKSTGEGAVSLHEMHGVKEGTPTMGGILINGSLLLSVLLFANWGNPCVWVAIFVIVGFGGLGFLDDYLKVSQRNHKGLSARVKLAGQILIGLLLGVYMKYANLGIHYAPTNVVGNTFLTVPFFKMIYPNLGFLFIPFVVVVLTASSNAVNLTDGLDGLAAGCAIICTIAFGLVTYFVGNAIYSSYLLIPAVPVAGELVVVLSALVGACLGFLWFNAHPAQVFMGDVGSLTIGGLLGTVAVLIREEVLLVIIGGIFVVEALSVIIQVASYKLRKKRVFLMSPIHHHFEKLGWHETRIVTRFWIVAALLAMLGLSTLKLR